MSLQTKYILAQTRLEAQPQPEKRKAVSAKANLRLPEKGLVVSPQQTEGKKMKRKILFVMSLSRATHAATVIAVFTLMCLTGTFAFRLQNQFIDKFLSLSGHGIFQLTLPDAKTLENSKLKPNDEIPESAVYEQLFRLVNRFEEQAAKQETLGNGKGVAFLRGYFERKAQLNPQQANFLKKAAKEFSDQTGRLEAQAQNLIDAKSQKPQADNPELEIEKLKQQREALPLLYRQMIQEFFGAVKFEQFAAFVHETIASKMVRLAIPENMGGYGFSEIFYDNGDVYGYSTTMGGFARYCDPKKSMCPYSFVTATITSEIEGFIDYVFDENCGVGVEVDFYVSGANYNDTYWVFGEHGYIEDEPYCQGPFRNQGKNSVSYSGTSSDSVDTPALNVTAVGFQLIATDSPPIDQVNGSLRIFPDDNTPGDTTNRQRIRVTARLSENIAGQAVYFRNFDLDDPSADMTIDPNGNAGDDNNGMPNAGRLNNSNGQATVSATTNSNGVATVEFTVTMQPGDNFAIAASRNQNYINAITVNGTDLRNGGALIDTTCADTDNACRTEMLTVWRRLHIEVDSMGASGGNYVLGTIPVGERISGNGTTTITINPSPANPLEINRFENGRLYVVSGNSFDVISNTADTLTVRNRSSSTVRIPDNIQFQLYDDDDFDNDNGTLVYGDTGEDIPMLERNYLDDSDDPSLNRFAPAYIRPRYDIGDNNNTTVFATNVATDDNEGLRILFDFDQMATEASQSFWTVYLLSGYQHVAIEDGDPTDDDGNGVFDDHTAGITDREPDTQGIRRGRAGIVFLETNGFKECFSIPPFPTQSVFCNIYATKIHEIGHLFGAEHTDMGVMSDSSTEFSPISINAIRRRNHP